MQVDRPKIRAAARARHRGTMVGVRWRVGLGLIGLALISACSGDAGFSVGGRSATPVAQATLAPAPVVTLKVTTAPGSPNDQPMWVAVEAGLMQRNGVAIEFVSAPATQGIASLVSGQTDIAATGGAEALGGLAGGADLVIVANLVPVIPWQFYAGPGIQSPTDLRGKRIGITTAGASYDTALRIVLPRFGIDPDK